MTSAARFLYLARHAEASADEAGLSERGRRQAVLLGERLRDVRFDAVHHGPLARAAGTAELIRAQLVYAPAEFGAAACAGDYLPRIPARDEAPPSVADRTLERLASFPAEERDPGPRLAREAVARFTGPAAGDRPRRELVVTHNFTAAWLVRDAFAAPDWRWIGVNLANAALTVVRYAPDRPADLLCFNDTGHLPADLRWTGLPAEPRI
ncbi:histidine phosphatase family protein [Streptomyces sp. NPDC060194]|uniref:histidine phosphatase family protein n=1 Tax=Streptomyces sp. NPDC060194 TaxID=3347069 RepID=UPI003648B0EF